MRHSDHQVFETGRRVDAPPGASRSPLTLRFADLVVPPAPVVRAGGWLESALCADVRVMTPTGPRAAGLLRVGDEVLTLDHGAQPVLWAGRRDVAAAQIRVRPEIAPLPVAASAFGPGAPRRPLRLSPRAGILIAFDRAPGGEVLGQAADLLGRGGGLGAGRGAGRGAGLGAAADVAYVQLLLPVHALIGVDGLLVETLHPARLGAADSDAALHAAVVGAVIGAMPELDHGLEFYGPEIRPRVVRRP